MNIINKKNKNKKSYLFLDEIWHIIKEYAGIYSIKMDWEQKLPIINPLNHFMYVFYLSTKTPEHWDWGDLTEDYLKKHSLIENHVSIETKINIIKKTFWNKHKKSSFPKSVFFYLQKNLFPDNKLWTPPPNLKIGDEIVFKHKMSVCNSFITYNWLCGVVSKINKFNIDVDIYNFDIIYDYYNYNTSKCNVKYSTSALFWKKNEPKFFTIKITKRQFNSDSKFIDKSKLFTHGIKERLYYNSNIFAFDLNFT